MYIDGDIYLVDAGVVARYVSGRSSDWSLDPPPDELLRPAPTYTLVDSPDAKSEGLMYAYDRGSDRIVAFAKPNGKYVAQYRIAEGGPDWSDVRAFYVVNRAEGQAPLVYWIDADRIGAAVLQDASTLPSPAPSASPAASPDGSTKPKPTATPAP
jgi:hypothetical protein